MGSDTPPRGFVVRYRRRARTELNTSARYFKNQFLDLVEEWLQTLADDAFAGEEGSSEDAAVFFTQLYGETGNPPITGLRRWLSATLREKILALRILLRDRQSPWAFRMAMNVFLVPNPVAEIPRDVPVVVLALYEVDRVNGRIVVTMFPELPGPEGSGNR